MISKIFEIFLKLFEISFCDTKDDTIKVSATFCGDLKDVFEDFEIVLQIFNMSKTFWDMFRYFKISFIKVKDFVELFALRPGQSPRVIYTHTTHNTLLNKPCMQNLGGESDKIFGGESEFFSRDNFGFFQTWRGFSNVERVFRWSMALSYFKVESMYWLRPIRAIQF